MPADPRPATISKAIFWAGVLISTLPVLLLLMSATMKLISAPPVLEGFPKLGYPAKLAFGLGVVEMVCTILYVIPRTNVLGAILLTGYLGGATATHVRVSEPYYGPVVLGVLVWGGLYLRDRRIRSLIPFKSCYQGDCVTGVQGAQSPKRGSWLKRIFLLLLVSVIGFAAVVAMQSPEFRLERKTTISAPPAAVFAQVNDFHAWNVWSPWAKLDPNMQVTYEGPEAGPGAIYKWSGNDEVGEGKMTILESHPSDLVKIQLEFIRPFAGINTTEFKFQPKGEQTEVTWTMYGPKSFMIKAVHLFMDMDKLVGADFEKGLSQMKAVVEEPKSASTPADQ